MITLCIRALCFVIDLMILWIISFLFLCMNVFTIPITLLLYLICKVFKLQTPRPRFYSLMIYPSWSKTAKYSFLNTVARYNQRNAAKARAKQRRQFEVTRPWEARFFD